LSSGLALRLLASTRSKSHPKPFIHGVEAKCLEPYRLKDESALKEKSESVGLVSH